MRATMYTGGGAIANILTVYRITLVPEVHVPKYPLFPRTKVTSYNAPGYAMRHTCRELRRLPLLTGMATSHFASV